VVEHYHNLTLKTMFSLKYFLDGSNFEEGKIPDYIFKADDDTFVNLANLYPTIHSQTKNLGKRIFFHLPSPGFQGWGMLKRGWVAKC
jgi:hypothetical protein